MGKTRLRGSWDSPLRCACLRISGVRVGVKGTGQRGVHWSHCRHPSRPNLHSPPPEPSVWLCPFTYTLPRNTHAHSLQRGREHTSIDAAFNTWTSVKYFRTSGYLLTQVSPSWAKHYQCRLQVLGQWDALSRFEVQRTGHETMTMRLKC